MTEKATQMVSVATYTFEVGKYASKHQVADTLEKLFKIKVAAVRMVKRKGKIKKSGRQQQAKTLPDRKIAYVTLSEGKIELFPQS